MNEISAMDDHIPGPLSINAFGDKFLFNVNRRTFEKIAAAALFETRFADRLFTQDALNIVVGTDSGLLPRFIRQKGFPNGSRYIFIEPEDVLRSLQYHGLIDEDDDRLVCITLDHWADAVRRFKITDYFFIDAVRSFSAICAQDDYIDTYAELSWHIAEVLSQLHWRNNLQLGAEAFMSRQIYNVIDNRVPASLMKDAFQGRTVVILAGGPSLDAALPWVRVNRNRFVVFAVSRIARQLLAHELEPDFVFSVDPTELSFDVSKEMLKFSDRPVFVCSHHTVPKLQGQWLGRMLYLGARVPWESDLNVDNISSAGPTVTNTALNVAHAFGFKRIVLAGVDLCFTRQGFTHAAGSNEHLAGPRFDLTSLQVETNGGFKAPTSSDFALAIDALGAQAKIIRGSGCEIINISDAAARIQFVDYRAVSDLILNDSMPDVEDILASRLAGVDTSLEADFRQVALALDRASYQIETACEVARQAGRINDAMYNDAGLIADPRDKKKLDRLEKTLRRDHKQFGYLIKKFGIRNLIKLTKPFSDEEWTAEEAKALGRAYYEAYQDGANKLQKLICEARNRMEARRQEILVQPDFALMLEQCAKEGSYGRVRLWRRRFELSLWPKDIQAICDDYERRFWLAVDDRNTRHFAQVKKHSQLSAVKHRAALLFKHKKAEELRDLSASLEKHDDSSGATSYRCLIDGYLAELAGDPEVALDAYHPIVEAGDALLEEALSRIAAITLNLGRSAEAALALDCLSQINPVYLPIFAELAKLQGDLLKAVDAYNLYIRQFPRDELVQLKLVQLYTDCGVYDGAEMMLNFVLEQNPNHATALAMRQQLATARSGH